MKINRKNIIIAVVVIFFLIGIIPKIARYITTSLNEKENHSNRAFSEGDRTQNL